MAIVATAGFFYFEVWQYQRPFYANFTADTVNDFYNSFLQEIWNSNSIILVMEDSFKKDKYNLVYNVLKVIYPLIKNANSVIVSIGIISLPEGSNRSGQF